MSQGGKATGDFLQSLIAILPLLSLYNTVAYREYQMASFPKRLWPTGLGNSLLESKPIAP